MTMYVLKMLRKYFPLINLGLFSMWASAPSEDNWMTRTSNGVHMFVSDNKTRIHKLIVRTSSYEELSFLRVTYNVIICYS